MNRFILLDTQDPQQGFDNVVIGVVEMTPDLAGLILKRGKLFKELQDKDDSLCTMRFHNTSCDFYSHDGELTTEQYDALVDECPVVLEKLPFPADSLMRTEYDEMVIERDGVWWRTSSKHSEVFTTTSVIRFEELEQYLQEDA